MNPPRVLSTLRLNPDTSIVAAQPQSHRPVTLESPALEVMTDLTQVKAATTHPDTTLLEAEQVMIFKGVRMLFVVSTMPAVDGLITTSDLHGVRAMQRVQEKGVRYDELLVSDVMTALARLDGVDLRLVQGATVGDAIATLQHHGRNHLVVVESSGHGEASRIRGVISRSQIERQLGQPVVVTPIASSFSEIERALG